MEKDGTMDGCNGSAPKELRRILVFLHRYWLLLFGGFTLLSAICTQHFLPQWPVYVVQYLQENLLVMGTVALLLLFLLVWKVPKWQVANITNEKDRLATESGFRQTLVQIVGGAALLGGFYFTAQTLRTSQDTLRITQQGQITERFTKAIEQLGDKKRLMVRLGGIYALERIAKDSASDHWSVMEVLTAFVREQSPAQTMPLDKTSGEKETEKNSYEHKPPSDIQAILTVIGRRTSTFGNGESEQLNLHNTNLQGADLRNAQLQRAFLERAQLQGADLRRAQLQEAVLGGAHLQGTDLRGAQLQKAQLQKAQLQGADLTAVENLIQDQISMACADEHTKLPQGLTRPGPCPTNP
jgi:Pentapeptide repeats (8 copies)